VPTECPRAVKIGELQTWARRTELDQPLNRKSPLRAANRAPCVCHHASSCLVEGHQGDGSRAKAAVRRSRDWRQQCLQNVIQATFDVCITETAASIVCLESFSTLSRGLEFAIKTAN
jgi:hypothetical protein